MVPREKPKKIERIREREEQKEAFQVGGGREPVSFRTVIAIALVTGIVLTAGFMVWSNYFIHREQEEISGTKSSSPRVGVSEPSALRIRPDMLRVTSIFLGRPRFAVVNGMPVGEGDPIEIKTEGAPVTLRVARIEDGFVHFKCDGQMIDVKLSGRPEHR